MADPKALIMDQHQFVHTQNKRPIPLVVSQMAFEGVQGEKQTQSSSNLSIDLFFLKEKGRLVIRKERGCSCSADHN